MEKTKRKYSKTDRLILGIGFTLLGLFVLSIAIPIVYVILASFMDPTVLNNQGLSFRFKDWTIDAYRRVLENEMIWRGFINSCLLYTSKTASVNMERFTELAETSLLSSSRRMYRSLKIF